MPSHRAPKVVQAREPRAACRAARPKRALLDVNVLIALLDTDHIHHARAAAWLSDNIGGCWASFAITQNACVRIMSQPGYPNALPTARVAERLREATETAAHAFVPGDVSLLDSRHFDTEQLLGHRQVTDAYLLGLAAANDLRFATFDGAMPSRVVRETRPAYLVVL